MVTNKTATYDKASIPDNTHRFANPGFQSGWRNDLPN